MNLARRYFPFSHIRSRRFCRERRGDDSRRCRFRILRAVLGILNSEFIPTVTLRALRVTSDADINSDRVTGSGSAV